MLWAYKKMRRMLYFGINVYVFVILINLYKNIILIYLIYCMNKVCWKRMNGLDLWRWGCVQGKFWCQPVSYQTLCGKLKCDWHWLSSTFHPFHDGDGHIGKLLIALLTRDYQTNIEVKNQHLKLCITLNDMFHRLKSSVWCILWLFNAFTFLFFEGFFEEIMVDLSTFGIQDKELTGL